MPADTMLPTRRRPSPLPRRGRRGLRAAALSPGQPSPSPTAGCPAPIATPPAPARFGADRPAPDPATLGFWLEFCLWSALAAGLALIAGAALTLLVLDEPYTSWGARATLWGGATSFGILVGAVCAFGLLRHERPADTIGPRR